MTEPTLTQIVDIVGCSYADAEEVESIALSMAGEGLGALSPSKQAEVLQDAWAAFRDMLGDPWAGQEAAWAGQEAA